MRKQPVWHLTFTRITMAPIKGNISPLLNITLSFDTKLEILNVNLKKVLTGKTTTSMLIHFCVNTNISFAIWRLNMLNLLPLPAAGPLRLVTLDLLKDLFSLCG